METTHIMKHLRRSALLAGAAIVALAPAANAHPGHDTFSHGVSHAVTSGNHVAALAAAGVALFLLGFAVNRTPLRRSLQCLGALLAIGAAFWGFAA